MGSEAGNLEAGKLANLASSACPTATRPIRYEFLFDSDRPVVALSPRPCLYGLSRRGAARVNSAADSLTRDEPVDFAADGWFLTGPTAAGKTAVGVELARQIGAEIISMDSMALYRGMDIGTAKPTPASAAAVPHHLIDVLEPHEEYSLAQYLDAAGQAADDIRGRGRAVLFVGGTPLYLKGLLRGIFQGPAADWALAAKAGRRSPPARRRWLHRRLAAIDPAAAAPAAPQRHAAADPRHRGF